MIIAEGLNSKEGKAHLRWVFTGRKEYVKRIFLEAGNSGKIQGIFGDLYILIKQEIPNKFMINS